MKQGEAPSILVFIPLMLSCNVDRLSNNNRVKVAPASTEWSNSTLTSDGWMDASPSAESNSTSSLPPSLCSLRTFLYRSTTIHRTPIISLLKQ